MDDATPQPRQRNCAPVGPKTAATLRGLAVERFVMEIASAVAVTTASAYGDVSVAEVQSQPSRSTETMTVSAPWRLATAIPEAVPSVTAESRDTRQRQLVTAIAILSPTNKRGAGRIEYLRKRQRLVAQCCTSTGD